MKNELKHNFLKKAPDSFTENLMQSVQRTKILKPILIPKKILHIVLFSVLLLIILGIYFLKPFFSISQLVRNHIHLYETYLEFSTVFFSITFLLFVYNVYIYYKFKKIYPS